MSEGTKTIPMDRDLGAGADGDPRTRTGRRVRELVKDVEADLTDVEELLARARRQLGSLEREAKGVNGLSAACRGWGQQLDKLIVDLGEERSSVERAMLGTGRPIVESIDGELRDRIRIARLG